MEAAEIRIFQDLVKAMCEMKAPIAMYIRNE